MNIDRGLVKAQAKQLIKGRVFALFIITAVVFFLVGGITMSINVYTTDTSDIMGPINDYSYDDSESQNTPDDFYDYFYNGGDSSSSGNGSSDNPIENFGSDESSGSGSTTDNPIESFGQSYTPSTSSNSSTESYTADTASTSVLGFISRIFSVLAIVLSPLAVSLQGFYCSFVRRNPNDEFNLGSELKNLFSVSFNGTYGKKIALAILNTLFIGLLSLLLIVPGIIYYYITYFSFQIMCDYPNLKPMEALKLSGKIVKGNKGELFALDLSFIGWALLCIVTFGISNIYAMPYCLTTRALYYENFKNRALADGRVTPYDFLSQDEKDAGFTPNEQAFYGQYPNFNQQAQNTNPNGAQGGYYYNPQNAQPQQYTQAPPTYDYTANEPQNSGEYPPYSYNPAPNSAVQNDANVNPQPTADETAQNSAENTAPSEQDYTTAQTPNVESDVADNTNSDTATDKNGESTQENE